MTQTQTFGSPTSNPSLGEIVREKNIMEARIQSLVQIEVQRFAEQTGITPCTIDIRMCDVTTLSSEVPVYIVGRVEAEIRL